MLPPRSTLRVGLFAPQNERIRRIASEKQISESEAAHQIKQIDRERRMFVKDHFRKDPLDMEQYDITLNTGRYSDEQCAILITEALD
jgi:cytidylate kinase